MCDEKVGGDMRVKRRHGPMEGYRDDCVVDLLCVKGRVGRTERSSYTRIMLICTSLRSATLRMLPYIVIVRPKADDCETSPLAFLDQTGLHEELENPLTQDGVGAKLAGNRMM